jgi:hypothetical protein
VTKILHSGGDKGMKMGIKSGRGNDRWSGGECGGTKMMAGQQGLSNVQVEETMAQKPLT